MRKNKSKMFIRPWIDAFLAICCVVLINAYFIDTQVSFDLTEDGRFSLSSSSKDIVENIQDDVEIMYFTNEEPPQSMVDASRSIDDMLLEVQRANPDHVKITRKYPIKNEDDKKDADTFGIPDIKFNVIENDRVEVVAGYSGLAILYRDKQEIIPVIASTKTIEYQIMAPLSKLVLAREITVGFVSGHNEYDALALKSLVGEQYMTAAVTLDSIPEVDALCLIDPKIPLTDEEKYNLDQYIMRGGGVIMLLNGSVIDLQTLDRQPSTHELDSFLEKYGITVTNNVVADFTSHERITLNKGDGPLTSEYPLWPIFPEGVNREHPITANAQIVLFPWASEINLQHEGSSALLETTDKAYGFTQEELPNFWPDRLYKPNATQLSKKLVAGIIEGNVVSAFSETDYGNRDGFIESTENASITVFGGTQIIQNQIIKGNPLNAYVVVSAIDYSVNESSLSEARGKSIQDRFVNAEADIDSLSWGSIVSVVGIVIAGFFIVFGVRIFVGHKMKKKYVHT